MPQLKEYSSNELEALYAVAVGQFKEAKRYQVTQAILQSGGFAVVEPLISGAELQSAVLVLEECERLNLEVWPITGSRYPKALREISAPPPVLYAHTLSPAQSIPTQSIGVVGTRAASIEMCEQTSELSAALARGGLTVVSGLALGIDGAAHRGALRTGIDCPTISVLAHGLDRVYPPTHQGLARGILDAGGIIISEYAPGVEPMKHHFLARNRIIAGLSRGVVVVQAGARSGSLVTANFAADYGRDVFVMTDATGEECGSGGLSLIEQGAIPISCASEVLREYGLTPVATPDVDSGAWISMNLDSFVAVTSLSPGELLRLELEGRIVRLPGNKVRVSPQIVE